MSTIANLYADVKTLCQQWFYTKNEVDTALDNLVDTIYPVGSIYMSVNSTSPQTLFGGTWEQIEDKFLLASGTSYSNGATGGEATHTLTTDEMPSHTHIQDSHNHTQNAHNHTPTTTNNKYLTTTQNIKISGSTRAWASQVSSGGTHYVYVENTDYTSATMTEEANTKNTTATNNSQTATNQNTGGGQAHNNMPPYLAVNVWKRTA